MKKGLLLLLLLLSLLGKAQTDTSDTEIVTPPDSTAIGAYDGIATNKEIGPEGGRIISEDGRIELIFPAGALTETKTIRIQPTINHAPNGAGKSYWFEPSGTQFKKPVRIIFHYSDEEAETCPPDLMAMAIQSKSGKWSFVEYDDVDTVSKTLKGFIHHFSGGSNVYKLKLEAAKNYLRVKESTKIKIWKYYTGKDFDILMERTSPSVQPVLWYVNRIEMGNTTVGYITDYEQTFTKTKQSIHRAGYTAPDYIIKKNPVTVSVDLYVSTGQAKLSKRAATLRVKIKIHDVYQITVNFTTDFPGADNTAISDSSTFFCWVLPDRIVIDNIKNYNPYVSKQGKGPCTLIILPQGYNGFLHLNNAYRNFKLSADNPPEVLFDFLPMYESPVFKFQWICKKFPPSPVEVAYAIPISPEINFIANGQTQRINFNKFGTIYKILVIPYRPDAPPLILD